MLVNKHFDLSYYVKFLPLVFEVVEPDTLRLLEDDELLSLHIDNSLMAKVELE